MNREETLAYVNYFYRSILKILDFKINMVSCENNSSDKKQPTVKTVRVEFSNSRNN